jgi:hypothetical protein
LIKFSPANEKSQWSKLEISLVDTLTKELRGKSLDDKIKVFGETIYQHCYQLFGTIEKTIRGARVAPHRSRRQLKITELRRQKNVARKQFMNAMEGEKEDLSQIWEDLKKHHRALSRAERFCKKRRLTREAR